MSALGQTMPIDSACRTSAFASYRPETAVPLSANSGRSEALGVGPTLVESLPNSRRTCRGHPAMSAFGGKADLAACEYTRPSPRRSA
jgi:hypothetical protein